MAEAEALRSRPCGTGHDLVAQADAQQRPAVGHDLRRQRHRPIEDTGVPRPW